MAFNFAGIRCLSDSSHILLSNINFPTVLFAGENVCKMTAGKFIGRGLLSNMNLSPLSLCRTFFIKEKCLQSDSGEKFIGRWLLSEKRRVA